MKKCSRFKKLVLVFCVALLPLTVLSGCASATGTGAGLPWESAIKTLSDSLSGPVAFALGILMIVAGASGIMFGGDLQGWIRWACLAAIVAGMIGAAPSVLNVFGLSACVVA